ncbi:MAG: hypothetical protein ACUVRE_08765, partial [Thermoanaerobaculaceae bacterium]
MSQNPFAIFVVLCVALMAAVGAGAQAPPPPVFDHIGVQATCTFDAPSQTYKYQYMVTNPPTNTLELWTLKLPLGLDGSVFGTIQAPEEWDGRVSDPSWVDDPARFPRKSYISWCPTVDQMVNPPSPGTTTGPFAFSVYVPPAISDLWISPWTDPYWDAYMQATGEDEVPLEVSVPLELSLIRKIPTLGPLGVSPGSFE